MQDIRIRVNAYNTILKLKEQNVPQKEIIQKTCKRFDIPYGTVYNWYKYDNSPFGKRKIKYKKELLYILGALMGDGCAYHWKKGNKYIVLLVGEKGFIEKYAYKLFDCTGKKIKGFPYKDKNAWHIKTWNMELFELLKNARENQDFLMNVIKNGDYNKNMLQFIEGYFDAEGCVKVIREKVRITPKICLDICSIDYNTLEIIRKALNEILLIEARYSIQKEQIGKDGIKRKKAYHLRIYKKEYIKRFFENISTIKLKPEKVDYVINWLNNGK